MNPRALMIIGSAVGIFILACSFVGVATSGTIVVTFAAGCLFGNGYGVWEERSRR